MLLAKIIASVVVQPQLIAFINESKTKGILTFGKDTSEAIKKTMLV